MPEGRSKTVSIEKQEEIKKGLTMVARKGGLAGVD